MSLTQPAYNAIPFARDAVEINTIPDTSGKSGAASWTEGFPPETMIPLTSRGIPPSGQDLNGVLKQLSSHQVWLNAGGQYKFNAALAAAVGGYALGAVVNADDNSKSYINTLSGNTSNPNTGGAGWNVFCDSPLRANLASITGALLVNFQYGNATGAQPYSLYNFMTEMVSPLGFMSTAMQTDVLTGSPVMDHTAAIQAAINTGRNVDLKGLKYNAHTLTQGQSGQTITSSQGVARITKNANGDLFTSNADNVRLQNINFYGDASTPTFTGDGVVMNGDSPVLNMCGSRWMSGRALKCTGGHVAILGTSDIYQTTDTTSTGYDIEIGMSGTSTLYHQIHGVVTSQRTGGILLIDTGSHCITGGQFGKLSITSGTSPSGINGGNTVGARILGNVLVQISSASFSSNTFDAINFTFAKGTSGCRFDASNTYANGFTITNLGNLYTNIIARTLNASSISNFQYGDDSNSRKMSYSLSDATQAWQPDGSMVLPNTQGYKVRDNAAVAQSLMSLSSGNQVYIGTASYPCTMFSSTSIGFLAGGATICQVVSGAFRPFNDNNTTLGSTSQRWSTVYAATGTINTSDERLKQQWRSQSEAEKAAALEIKSSIGLYKFNDAVAKKGDGARWHVGVKAQQVVNIMTDHDLDPMAYGFVCYDEWEETPEIKREAKPAVYGENGDLLEDAVEEFIEQPHIAAGNRYGVRYDELIMFILAAI